MISGGYDNPDANALAADTHPSADGLSWVIDLAGPVPVERHLRHPLRGLPALMDAQIRGTTMPVLEVRLDPG